MKSKCMSSDCASGNPILSARTEEELMAQEYLHYATSKKEGASYHSCRDFRSDAGEGNIVRDFTSKGYMGVRVFDAAGNVFSHDSVNVRELAFFWAHPEVKREAGL